MSIPADRPLAVVWLELATADPERAIAFYGAVLGWAATEPVGGAAGSRDFSTDGAAVAGLRSRGGDGPDAWTPYFAVADLDATLDAARSAGAGHVGPAEPAGDRGRRATLLDPAGAAFGCEEAADSAGLGRLDAPGAPSWFELRATDFAAAATFYRMTLGWQLTTLGDADEFRMAVVGAPATATTGIVDAARDGETTVSHWLPYFGVADADTAARAVREHGGLTLDEPVDTPNGRIVHVVDPGGCLLALLERPAS